MTTETQKLTTNVRPKNKEEAFACLQNARLHLAAITADCADCTEDLDSLLLYFCPQSRPKARTAWDWVKRSVLRGPTKSAHRSFLQGINVIDGTAYASDGHRIHQAEIPNLPDGFYPNGDKGKRMDFIDTKDAKSASTLQNMFNRVTTAYDIDPDKPWQPTTVETGFNTTVGILPGTQIVYRSHDHLPKTEVCIQRQYMDEALNTEGNTVQICSPGPGKPANKVTGSNEFGEFTIMGIKL